MQKLLFLYCLLFTTTVAQAQSVPAPGSPQTKTVYLIGGTIHVGDGTVIERGTLGFAEGKITLVSDNIAIRIDSSQAIQIDASGMHIYPGFISTNTVNGLVEVQALRQTRDSYEVGNFKPHVRTIIAYNTDSWVTPTVRSNGILLSQIRPVGGRIAGTSAVVQHDAWNYEDAVVKEEDGIFVSWPSVVSRGGWWGSPGKVKSNEKYDDQIMEMRNFFTEAQAYCLGETNEQPNLVLAAMCPCFTKDKTVYIGANQAKAITDAVAFSKEFPINMVLIGGTESWLVTDVLKENNIPVILARTHRLPFLPSADVDMPFKLPSILQKEGILFAMTAQTGSGEQRNLPFTIGKSVAFGLSKEEALMAITKNPAEILGIADRVGTLEEGKDATLIISEGDALDVLTNEIVLAFIEGRPVNLDNKQKELYRKFMEKYGFEPK